MGRSCASMRPRHLSIPARHNMSFRHSNDLKTRVQKKFAGITSMKKTCNEPSSRRQCAWGYLGKLRRTPCAILSPRIFLRTARISALFTAPAHPCARGIGTSLYGTGVTWALGRENHHDLHVRLAAGRSRCPQPVGSDGIVAYSCAMHQKMCSDFRCDS